MYNILVKFASCVLWVKRNADMQIEKSIVYKHGPLLFSIIASHLNKLMQYNTFWQFIDLGMISKAVISYV
jgi:hypothetical protein